MKGSVIRIISLGIISLGRLNGLMSVSSRLHLPTDAERSESGSKSRQNMYQTSMVQNGKEYGKIPEAEGLCHADLQLLLGMVLIN